jgi:hypothetical protein
VTFGTSALEPHYVKARIPTDIESLCTIGPDNRMEHHTSPELVAGAFCNLLLGRVGLRTFMAPEGPSLRLEPGGLVGALGLALAQKLTRNAGFAICSGCSSAFTPSRKPPQGRRAWCPKCRTDGRDKAAAALDYRKRRLST